LTEDAVRSLLEKLRAFIANELDDQERALFAALLAPGVAQAYEGDEVEAFGLTIWSPGTLPEALASALRESGVRVEGLGL
jgi:hypothetical protein